MSATDKVKNSAERIVGEAKEALGKVTGNESLEAEGHKDQAKGNLKDAGEQVKDAGNKVKDAFKS